MLSFRSKILIGYILAFSLAIAAIYPLAGHVVNSLVYKAMESRADEFIAKLQTAPEDISLIRRLKADQHLTFFRVSVISSNRNVLYDSHTTRLFGPAFSQEFIVEHPEVLKAFQYGTGFAIEYSDLLGYKFIYFAKRFDFHGQDYVIRLAFPYTYVEEGAYDFRITLLIFSVSVLLLTSLLTWFIVSRLTDPITQIIQQVDSYRNQPGTSVPKIELGIKDPSNDFVRLAGTFNSLSERIQLQFNTLSLERNERAAILDTLAEGVIAVDPNLHVIFANKTALKMFDLEGEKVLNQHIDILKQKKATEQLHRTLKENASFTELLELKGPTGRIYLETFSAPKEHMGGAILILHDQSQSYRMIQMRRNFISNASHELKTPITIIGGFAEALGDNPDLPKERIQEITQKIIRNCERMTNLIKDLLALSDIEHLPYSRLLHVDLVELLEKCLQTVQEVYPGTKVHLHAPGDKPYYLTGDPRLLEMAFSNLLSNGAKYSEPPADLTVSLAHQEGTVSIAFADKGFGIPEEELENIFQRFYRIDFHQGAKIEGTGLGLSLVETIIEKHGGSIKVDSAVGVGTTFTLTLPVGEEPQE